MANRSIPQKHTIDMFNQHSDEDLPLPLIVAKNHGFSLQYHEQASDLILYSVHDWISGVAQTDNANRFWADLQKRAHKAKIELYASCVQLPYKAANGKTYQMDFASDVILYSVTQRMDTNTGIRNGVLEYLAKAGALVDEMRQDPESAQNNLRAYRQEKALRDGRSEQWITVRELGIEARNQFTASVVAKAPDINIGEATNIIYKSTLGSDAAGLRTHLHLGKKQNPRDHMSMVALSYLMTCEATISAHLEGLSPDDIVPPETVKRVIHSVAELTGKQAQETAKLIGIDLVSGRKLLTGGQS